MGDPIFEANFNLRARPSSEESRNVRRARFPGFAVGRNGKLRDRGNFFCTPEKKKKGKCCAPEKWSMVQPNLKKLFPVPFAVVDLKMETDV